PPAQGTCMAKKSPGKTDPPPGFVRTLELNHRKRVTALAFSPRGKVLASGSDDTTVKLANIESGERVAVQPEGEFKHGIIAVAMSPDGYTVASVSQGLRKSREERFEPGLWQPIPNTRQQPDRTERYSYPFLSPAFSPTERLVAFACDVVR